MNGIILIFHGYNDIKIEFFHSRKVKYTQILSLIFFSHCFVCVVAYIQFNIRFRMVYPGHEMIRFATIQGMYNRTITIGSAGKAFSATGWKLGW